MNRPSGFDDAFDIAIDALAKVGAQEAHLDDESIDRIARSAADLRRGEQQSVEAPAPLAADEPVIALDVDRERQPADRAHPWHRIGAVAAVGIVLLLAIGALSQRGQSVLTEPGERQDTAAVVTSLPTPDSTGPEGTLIVEAGPDTTLAEATGSETTAESDAANPETDQPPTSVETPVVESTVSTTEQSGGSAEPQPPEPPESVGPNTVTLVVGAAGTVELQIADNVITTAAVNNAADWNQRSEVDSDGTQRLLFDRAGASAWLYVRSDQTRFSLEIDQEGDGLRPRGSSSRAFDLGSSGAVTVRYDYLGLAGLDLVANDGWTLSVDSQATNELVMHLTGPANRHRTESEIRVGDLLIFIVTSDP